MSKDRFTAKHRRCLKCGHKWRPRGKRAACPKCKPFPKPAGARRRRPGQS